MKSKYRVLKIAILITVTAVVGLSATGCATSPPQATFAHEPSKQHLITPSDSVTVAVDARAGVTVADYEKQRLSQVIKQKIDASIVASDVAGVKRDYEVSVVLTQYEKGNAFARAMLAGIGQIHIDAHVTLITLPERKSVSEFDVAKTFAWGGIYGGTTRIEDVEPAFAEGIAEALTKGGAAKEKKGN
jgi:hypothetical protein